MLSPGTGKAAEPAVRADIDMPDRKISMTWTLRRDTESDSISSHTIEMMFKLPPDFAGSGILSVPGFWMKEGAADAGDSAYRPRREGQNWIFLDRPLGRTRRPGAQSTAPEGSPLV
jgi:hypothetical protein